MVGRTLDRYLLLEQVGQGGMAVVYRALDEPLNREVALKVLHPHLADQPESRARLQREARAVARLRHENILEIFAYSGIDSAQSYLVTEFIHGPTLRQFMVANPPAFPEIGAMVASELARALQCAHELDIIHRDIKPENVMIREDGTVVLCDFGIAQVVDKERMTTTGQLLGSPAYMSPEHIDGQPLDGRTDIFSLGVVLYQMVCGELPFRGRNPHETLKRIGDGVFAPPEERAPLCSARLSRIICRAMSRDPQGRYPCAEELRQDLLAELLESGITDPRAELAAYFKDPPGWTTAFRPRLARALRESGQRQRARGKTAAALAIWGRALLVDPKDAEVAALIRGVAQRGRVVRWAAAAVGLVVVGSGGLALRAGWHRAAMGPGEGRDLGAGLATGLRPAADAAAGADAEPGVEADGATRTQPAGPPPGDAVALTPGPRDATTAVPRPRRTPPAGAPRGVPVGHRPAAPVDPPRLVRLAPWPKAVRVSLNGRSLGDYGADVRTVELPEGDNELLFENPACYSERVRIRGDESPKEVRLRLRWKPALLMVKAHDGTEEGDVLVEGRIGRLGQVIALPLRSDDGRASVEVRVSLPGRKTVTRTVEIRANQLSTIEVSPEPL